jgi:DNA-binding MarR family transcriptional regulator
MQHSDKPLETVLSPLELAISLIIQEYPGITSHDIKAHLQNGKHADLGVTTGHYSRISTAIRKLFSAGKITRTQGRRDIERQRMGRVAFVYVITPQGEAAIQNTMAFRKHINPEA